MVMESVYKGDDTGAFGQDFLVINANIPTGWYVSKAEVSIGNIPKMTFSNPVFPLKVNLKPSQTIKLSEVNECHLAIYDDLGRKQTCEGTLRFKANDQVV